MANKNSIKNPEMGDSGKSWNVVTGCDKYSDRCLNCYAEDIAEWLKGIPLHIMERPPGGQILM